MFKINSDCTNCGICAEVCPRKIIVSGDNGPQLQQPELCVACGHCVAICPHSALDHGQAPIQSQVPLDGGPVLDSEAAERFLRSRRSVRCYKPDEVSREKLLQLANIARFAPTGGNSQGLSYIIVTKREEMKQLTEITIDWLEEQLAAGESWVKPYAGIVHTYRQTKHDVILRDAPHLIVATAPKAFTIGRDNTRYSLAYAELYAPSLGLGTCWAGFFEACAFSGYRRLYDQLNIADGLAITGAIMVGYPRYSFQRLVDRNPLSVTWR